MIATRSLNLNSLSRQEWSGFQSPFIRDLTYEMAISREFVLTSAQATLYSKMASENLLGSEV